MNLKTNILEQLTELCKSKSETNFGQIILDLLKGCNLEAINDECFLNLCQDANFNVEKARKFQDGLEFTVTQDFLDIFKPLSVKSLKMRIKSAYNLDPDGEKALNRYNRVGYRCYFIEKPDNEICIPETFMEAAFSVGKYAV